MSSKKKATPAKKPVAPKAPAKKAVKPPAPEVKALPTNTHCRASTVPYVFSDGSAGQSCTVCKATLKEIDGVLQEVRSMGGGEFIVVKESA